MSIESFTLTHDGHIEIVLRECSGQILLCNPPRPVPDYIKKQIYGVVNGKIELIKEIEGRHIPTSTNCEQIIFED